MKIALVTARHPSARGGAELLYDGIEAALGAEGHSVERIELRVDESTIEGLLAGYEAARELDLAAYDCAISTKAPTFNIRHPSHICYLVHTVRVFYDMYEVWTDHSPGARAQRDHVRELDARAFASIPEGRRFAIGREVAERLRAHVGFSARWIHPPLPDFEKFREGPFEHFLVAGRLHPWKRTELVLDAFASVPHDVRLLVTGAGEAGDAVLRRAAADPRVRLLGEVPRETLYDLYSAALAVPFVPIREDYGYVAAEAMAASKPVITASDSGEPTRLVRHERTGLVTAPDPAALAAAMTRLITTPDLARQFGRSGRARIARQNWPRVVKTLLGSLGPGTEGSRTRRRPRVLILDNQPIEPPVAGGRLRLHGLYSNLPDDLDPVYVGSYDWPGPAYRGVVHNGTLLEVTVPQSPAHFEAHEALRARDPSLTMDVTFPILSRLSPAFSHRVRAEARGADVLVLSHPWVLPTLSRLSGIARTPIVYDAQNVEAKIKADLLGDTPVGRAIVAEIERLEGELCRRSSAVLACSEEDADQFVRLYGIPRSRVHVVPNGVDTRRIRPAGREERLRARSRLSLPPDATVAVFIGSDYPPNRDAVDFICRDLSPKCPDVEFLLVGGSSSHLAGVGAPRNVRALGSVEPDVRDDALRAADVAVNPIRRGSGSNIKMLDFFAAGLPTLVTPVGARGLRRRGPEAFLVSSLEAFAPALEGLRGDPAMREDLSARARALAEKEYDWRELSGRTAEILRRVLARSGRGGAIGRRETVAGLAILSTWKTRCGIAGYTRLLTDALPREIEFSIHAEAGTPEPESDRVHRSWQYGLADLSLLERDLKANRPAFLLIQHHPGFFEGDRLRELLILCRHLGVPAGVTLHTVRNWNSDPSVAAELERISRVFVHRESDADLLRERGVVTPVRVIPQGIPRLWRRPKEEIRTAFEMPDGFWIGHFGYLRPHKGTVTLIEAFDRLARSRPEARLLLLCSRYPSEDSAAYAEICAGKIARSPHRSRIHASFDHLPFEEVASLLQACDVTVFPYAESDESSSAAARLAVAAHKPVVVSRSKIFEDLEEVAEVLPEEAPESIAHEIARLEKDPRRIEEAAGRARRFAARNEWGRIAALTLGNLPPEALVEFRRSPTAHRPEP